MVPKIIPLPETNQRLKRVLVANRGEIAVRVIRTCHALSVETVAIYVEEDMDSPYVKLATRSVCIGSADKSETSPYLQGDEIIRIAKSLDCGGIHPGYGYLSENAAFADKVIASGLIFIGPESSSIRTIGDKSSSKIFLSAHPVPLVPGYSGEDQNVQCLTAEADKIGFPLLIKASAGGGGKGMRIKHDATDLASDLERAASEAQRNFGDARLLLERYVDQGKHIEIQIMGDNYGNVYSLFERDCSIQRRHQKIIEECPSPDLSEAERAKIAEAARTIGKLLNYRGAGTVEFIFDVRSRDFFFLEVNTRLQVEHPITEMITGLDLVSLQLFVASGGDLSAVPEVTGVRKEGHSIECRLCAEDCFANFAPRTGTVRLWLEGLSSDPDVRHDTGIASGSEVSVFFDSMLAKLIVWAPTRTAALEKMAALLRHHVSLGVTTNQPFLLCSLEHPAFVSGRYTTQFIGQHLDALTEDVESKAARVSREMALAASVFLRTLRAQVANAKRVPLSRIPPGWANNSRDVMRDPLEELTITLPVGEAEQTFKVQTSAANPSHMRIWEDHADERVKELAKTLKKNKDKNEKRTVMMHRFYESLPSRSGTEGRSAGVWQHGVAPSDIAALNVTVPHVSVAELKAGNRRWYHGAVRIAVDGVESTFLVATGDYAGVRASTVAQTVFVHSPILGGFLSVRRRGLLAFAGEMDKRVGAGADALLAGDEDRYVSSMPCKILDVLASDGKEVAIGDSLLTMESMKTEVRLVARTKGVLKMNVKAGDLCSEGTILAVIAEPETAEEE